MTGSFHSVELFVEPGQQVSRNMLVLRIACEVRKLVTVELHIIQFDATIAVVNQRPPFRTQQMIVTSAEAVHRVVNSVQRIVKRRGQTSALHMLRDGQSAKLCQRGVDVDLLAQDH